MLGIENLKKAVDLGIDLEKITSHIVKNKTDWMQDFKDLFEHVPIIVAEVKAMDITQVPLEFKDIDAAEGLELIGYVASKLVVDNAKAQAIINASLKLVTDIIVDGVALSNAIKS